MANNKSFQLIFIKIIKTTILVLYFKIVFQIFAFSKNPLIKRTCYTYSLHLQYLP